MYTKHGLHFNRQGKRAISAMMRDKNSNELDHVEEIEDIEVVEANMNEVINHFKTNSSVAFSHSISADFDDIRQMRRSRSCL